MEIIGIFLSKLGYFSTNFTYFYIYMTGPPFAHFQAAEAPYHGLGQLFRIFPTASAPLCPPVGPAVCRTLRALSLPLQAGIFLPISG